MKYLVLCDYRENLKNYSCTTNDTYNDHPGRKNISEIITAIKSLGYDCDYFGGIPELVKAVDQHLVFKDTAFLNFTDGLDQDYSRVQAPVLLDILKVPYSGSDVFPSVIMNNKHYCKKVLSDSGIRLPKSCIANSVIPLKMNNISAWNFPLFVKPNCEGSSLGISADCVCHSVEDVKSKVNQLKETFDELLVEEFVPGIDVTVFLIGNPGNYYINDVIVAKLHDSSPYAVYDINAKHNKLRTLYYNAEKIPIKVLREMQSESEKIAEIIGARDICRIDYRLDIKTQTFSFIEINSAPRFSTTSEIGFIAQKRELSFADMLQYYLNAFNERIYSS